MIEERTIAGRSARAVDVEREFHNKRAATEDAANDRLSYVYRSVGDVLAIPLSRMREQSGDVLEVGCYLGDNAREAGRARRYVGIDISDVAIEKARTRFGADNVSFFCMDANRLEQLDGRFDFIFGNGVIHHLDLIAFSEGLKKKMRDNAIAVFVEPLEGPIWLRLFRRLTPQLRTRDEHPLSEQHIVLLREHFSVRLEYFGFFRPFLPVLFFNAGLVARFSEWLDRRIMRTTFGRRNAWLVVMYFRKRVRPALAS